MVGHIRAVVLRVFDPRLHRDPIHILRCLRLIPLRLPQLLTPLDLCFRVGKLDAPNF